MAVNWQEAQIHEKKFWESIYINKKKDDVYEKTTSEGWKNFAYEVLKRHEIDLQFINNKIIVDLGSGPGGVAKGFHEMLKKKELKNTKIIAVDPLMDFYKKEIKILQEDDNLKLLTNKGEDLDLESNSVDMIFSTNVLDHCDDANNLIKEAYRVLKPGGYFFPSLHLVYDYLALVKNYIKYFDTNHPHHFSNHDINKMLKLNFSETKLSKKFTIFHDQKKFSFKNIFFGIDKIRSLKRYLSNYILYTGYFVCKKK